MWRGGHELIIQALKPEKPLNENEVTIGEPFKTVQFLSNGDYFGGINHGSSYYRLVAYFLTNGHVDLQQENRSLDFSWGIDYDPNYDFTRINYEGTYKIISVENGIVNVNVQLTSFEINCDRQKKTHDGKFDAKLDLPNYYITLQKGNPLSYAFE